MAKLFAGLSINLQGYDYGRSLMTLSDTLTATERVIAEKRAGIEANLAAYNAGGVFIGEREDGVTIWEQSDAYEFELELLDESLIVLRKSYVILLYHSWERMVGRWAKLGPKPNHKELVEGMEKKGIKKHPRLDALRDLNNALKHNSKTFGAGLLTSWPEVLPAGFSLPENYRDPAVRPNWFEIITVTPDIIDEVVATLKASGPEGFPVAK
jgi:hypothetical protein